MTLVAWLLGAGGLVLVGLLAYWQLVIVEGTHLGTEVVTFLYDIIATRYDNIKQYEPVFEESFLGRPLARVLGDVRAPLILDVGTGTGRLPLALLDQPSFGGRIVALDASRPMLRVAARKLEAFVARVDLLWLDAASLPFPDSTFDAVTCLEMLEFTPDPPAQLAESVRVLRPGGVLLTTRRRGFDARLMPDKTHSAQEFRALLESLGLRNVEIQPWQVDYDLVWAFRGGTLGPGQGGARPLSEVLRCPNCGAARVASHEAALVCGACDATYAVCDGVVELRRASNARERNRIIP